MLLPLAYVEKAEGSVDDPMSESLRSQSYGNHRLGGPRYLHLGYNPTYKPILLMGHVSGL